MNTSCPVWDLKYFKVTKKALHTKADKKQVVNTIVINIELEDPARVPHALKNVTKAE